LLGNEDEIISSTSENESPPVTKPFFREISSTHYLKKEPGITVMYLYQVLILIVTGLTCGSLGFLMGKKTAPAAMSLS
jgi:hypothetical protein